MEFTLPGYDVEALVGTGGCGEVWRAREIATGAVVALKRLALRPDAARDIAVLEREAALLAALRHEHIVRLRAAVPTTEGLALVLDYAAGGSLAALIAARGKLTPGEVVTIATPIAEALAYAHASGLVHGDVSPANVLLTAAGKPLLADLGVAQLPGVGGAAPHGYTPGYVDPAVAAGSAATPASDVFALAATCYAALCGAVPSPGGADGSALADTPPALARVIMASLAADSTARPAAAAFAPDVFASCAAAPVDLAAAANVQGPADSPGDLAPPTFQQPERAAPADATPPAPLPPQRRWKIAVIRRAVVVGLAGCLLVGGAVGAGMLWAGRDAGAAGPSARASGPAALPTAAATTPMPTTTTAGTPTPTPASTPAAVDWADVLARLDEQRARAFATPDVRALDAVYTPGSPALAADRATVARLVASGANARGFAIHLGAVTTVTASASSTVLDVQDSLPGYDVAYADGRVEHHAARGKRHWRITLERVDGGAATGEPGEWRIASIAALGSSQVGAR